MALENVAVDPAVMQQAGAMLADRWFRITNLYRIVDAKGRLVKFVPNRVQCHFDANKHTRNIIGKSRQHGMTTWEAIDCLDQVLFGKNENVMIIAHRKTDASDIFQAKIQRAWESMPPALKQMVKLRSSTAESMEFETGKGLVGRMAVGTSGIGMTLSRAHISELSYLDVHEPDRAANIIRGVMAAAKFGRIDIESTGRGDSGFFFEYFMAASDETPTNDSQFKRFFYNYTWDDVKMNAVSPLQIKEITAGQGFSWDRFKEYQKLHKLTDRQITAYYFFWLDYGKDWDLLHSEYPTTIDEMFSSGADRLFSGEALDQQDVVDCRKVGRWYYANEMEYGHKYCIGVDVAEGIGQDHSAITVLDVTDNKVVATYASERIPPDQLAYEILTVAKKYNDPLVAVERNNHGHTTLSKLREIYDSKRIYKMKTNQKIREVRTHKYGWDTNMATKPKMFYDLSQAVNSQEIQLQEPGLIMEARMYTKDGVREIRPSENQTSHSDKLTACFIKGTSVLTENGQTPIEKIRVGDLVVTREGLRKVKAVASHEKAVIENIGLTGTPDHPVFCGDNVLKDLRDVCQRDMLYLWDAKAQKIARRSYTGARNTTDTQTPSGGNIACTTVAGQQIGPPGFTCTGRYGVMSLAKSLVDSLSTTKTEIRRIMISATSSLLGERSTFRSICVSQQTPPYLERTLKRTEKKSPPQSSNTTKKRRQGKWFVDFAEFCLGRYQKIQNIAHAPARVEDSEKKRKNHTNKESAKCVGKYLRQESHTRKDVQQNVLPPKGGLRIDTVYNLSVEGAPEYFANGVLVHNCTIAWQTRYEALELDLTPKTHDRTTTEKLRVLQRNQFRF